jgi:subtilase family serine protease
VKNKWLTLLQRTSCGSIVMVIAIVAVASVPGLAATGRVIAHNTPGFVATAKNLGAQDPATQVELSLWLRLHNQNALEALAQDLYDPKSPNFRHWLKSSDIKARFAPTDAEVKTVEQFLGDHNLKVERVGPNNYFVRAEGTVADVQKAFAVQINRFQVGDEVRYANTSDPYIAGLAGSLVSTVYGLDDGKFENHYVRAGDVLGGKKKSASASVAQASENTFYTNDCFPGTTTQQFGPNGISESATYTGNAYGVPVSAGGQVCGYAPQDVYTAYNLTGLYNEGFHGEGQTIVIIDWCVFPSIQQDIDQFDSIYGLSSLTVGLVNTPGPEPCSAPNPEVDIDVEWAHTVAPGANIELVNATTSSFADVDEATTYAINYDLGKVISGSFGSPEALTALTVVQQESVIAMLGAVSGIGLNYSTGDFGDFEQYYGVKTVNAPADSPYATAVGGVSLALNSDSTIQFQTGWGNNATILASWSPNNDGVQVPPIAYGFQYGSGGGPSGAFAKPSYQKHLPGKTRQLPDISWLADPFTGVPVVYIADGAEIWGIYGGTSVACPMFSALWAIANQEAGVSLGQAAPYLYSLPEGTITDVLPYSSAINLKGTATTPKGSTNYSAAQLAAPLGNTRKFYSALWNDPYIGDDWNDWFALTFGTDTSLVVKPGWDNVTGLGTPNPQALADYF